MWSASSEATEVGGDMGDEVVNGGGVDSTSRDGDLPR